MAYVGTPIDTRNTFQSLQGKRFNGDGSTTAFTLDVAPSSTLDIEVFVGNVRQDPNSAYTLSGTTLTFTGAPPSGTNNIYVVHQAKSVGTIDVPSSGVQSGSLASAFLTGQTDIGGAIADADLFLVDDGAGGTLRKTAASRIKTYVGGFDVTSITGATALATQPAAADEIVISDNGTLKRVDIKHISNTPAFHAVKSGAQSVNNSTSTLVTFETEQLDSDGTFASNRFTPGIAGRYFIYGAIVVDQLADTKANYAQIKKNGSLLLTSQINTGGASSVTSYVAGHVQLGDSDYVELFSLHNHGSAQNVASGTNPGSFFGGFRLTGMES
jgi:hypothetical protein